MGDIAITSRQANTYHAESVDALSEAYRVTAMSYVQTAPGRLDAEIHAVSTGLVDVREGTFQASVVLTTENAFPRFAIAMNLSGQSQLFGSPLTNSNIAYTNGHNGIFARVQGGSSWCNVSIDFELLERVAQLTAT